MSGNDKHQDEPQGLPVFELRIRFNPQTGEVETWGPIQLPHIYLGMLELAKLNFIMGRLQPRQSPIVTPKIVKM